MLGNSHAACIKNGWEQIKSNHPEHSIAFFASRQNGLRDLTLENNTLVPGSPGLLRDISFTSSGMKNISLNEYDAFFLYGLGPNLPALDQRISTNLIRQTCIDHIGRSLSFHIASMIHSATTAPIFIGHDPQHATNRRRITLFHLARAITLITGRPTFSGRNSLYRVRRSASLQSRCNKLNYAQAYAAMARATAPSGYILLEQPDATLAANRWNAKSRYSLGSSRLDLGDKISGQSHPNCDMTHMNSAFGVLYLETFFQQLQHFRST